jgi:hypothetical protein
MGKTCLLLAFCIISLTSCSKKFPASDADIQAFQKYYSSTMWYFVDHQWNPENINNVTIRRVTSIQLSFEFPSGTDIIYTEFEPSKPFTLKSFRGNGTFNIIPDVNIPIFQKKSDYTTRNPDRIILNGFVGAKRFQIEAKSGKNKTKEETLRDAITIANIAYNFLSESKDKVSR